MTQGNSFRFPDEEQDDEKVGAQLSTGGKEDDVEIEIKDDTPEADRNRKPLDRQVEDPTDEELGEYSDKVRRRIGDLTHARHDERRRREQVERERDELAQAAQTLMQREAALRAALLARETQVADATVSASEARLAEAKAKLKKAQEEFDTDAAVEAQAELADATLALRDAKKMKATPSQTQQDAVQTQQSAPAQPARPAADPKYQSWLQDNQWFGRQGNDEYTSFALGLHKKLVAQGLSPVSDEYYAEINRRMRGTFPELFEGEGQGRDTGKQTSRPATTVASVTRTTATPAGKKRIVLTQSQVAVAKRMGLTVEQYARELAKLEQ